MHNKKYIFEPYDDFYPELFQKEKSRISSKISIPIEIEHVGSTSVEGLGGKGIIDIAIAADFSEFENIKFLLEKLGYQYKPFFKEKTRMYFATILDDAKSKTRLYHIHLVKSQSPDWKDLIGFRDYLRTHSNELKKYAKIKKISVKKGLEGADYRIAKENMIKNILKTQNHPNK